MKSLLNKPVPNSGHWVNLSRVPVTIRGFPKNTRFRLYAEDSQASISLFNEEFDMGNSTTSYLAIEVPSHVVELLIRCRDSAGKYQCWEQTQPLKTALQGVIINIKPANFGKSLGDALRRIG